MARYYPGGSRVPGSKGYNPQPLPNDVMENNPISDWLYGDWSEEKYNTFKFWYSVPVVRDYFDYLLDRRSDFDYMSRYGIDWNDIHDPRKLKQTSSTARLYGHALNFVSDNIKRLYF